MNGARISYWDSEKKFRFHYSRNMHVRDILRKFWNHYGIATGSTICQPFFMARFEIGRFSRFPSIWEKEFLVQTILTEFQTHHQLESTTTMDVSLTFDLEKRQQSWIKKKPLHNLLQIKTHPNNFQWPNLLSIVKKRLWGRGCCF